MTTASNDGYASAVERQRRAPHAASIRSWRPTLRRLASIVRIAAAFAVPALVRAQEPTDSARARIAADSARVRRALERLSAAARASSPTLRAARANVDLAVARASASGPVAVAFLSAGLSEAPARNLDQGNLRFEVGRDLMTGPRRRRYTNAITPAAAHATISTPVPINGISCESVTGPKEIMIR